MGGEGRRRRTTASRASRRGSAGVARCGAANASPPRRRGDRERPPRVRYAPRRPVRAADGAARRARRRRAEGLTLLRAENGGVRASRAVSIGSTPSSFGGQAVPGEAEGAAAPWAWSQRATSRRRRRRRSPSHASFAPRRRRRRPTRRRHRKRPAASDDAATHAAKRPAPAPRCYCDRPAVPPRRSLRLPAARHAELLHVRPRRSNAHRAALRDPGRVGAEEASQLKVS